MYSYDDDDEEEEQRELLRLRRRLQVRDYDDSCPLNAYARSSHLQLVQPNRPPLVQYSRNNSSNSRFSSSLPLSALPTRRSLHAPKIRVIILPGGHPRRG